MLKLFKPVKRIEAYPLTIDYPGKTFNDMDIAACVKQHMTFFDRLDYRKVIIAGQYAFDLIAGCLTNAEIGAKNDNWKFKFDKDWKKVI